MAILNFTVDEAMNMLAANGLLPESVRDIRPEGDDLLLTVSGGIVVRVRRESFANGILKLSFGSENWAFKLADSLGKVDALLDKALDAFPFIRREGKSLFFDLNRALSGRLKGVRVKECEIIDGAVRIEFRS